ncbi:hypothetical protein PACTADRAFT_49807 [Pachysolen tannophilus NRRL Y-2460]|uniref:Ribosomal protein S16 n=1 Tax=Pachysolen tannophilus NRRL Y-2460 TaxID=669874 RepID=A0A1E4TXK4_PACTA|nr:hypothetical protein PACTADRAFT_49807 [Pachysolen tannophilus NRRL Y-2460]
MKGIVRIRLARFGRKHAPVYNIVVAKAKSGRDKKPIEVIGTYNPIPQPVSPEQIALGEKPSKDVKLDFDRSKYWLGVGAQPTPPIVKLFKKAGILNMEWPSPTVGPKIPIREIVNPKRDL